MARVRVLSEIGAKQGPWPRRRPGLGLEWRFGPLEMPLDCQWQGLALAVALSPTMTEIRLQPQLAGRQFSGKTLSRGLNQQVPATTSG